jgi:hypothetical protein
MIGLEPFEGGHVHDLGQAERVDGEEILRLQNPAMGI